MTLREIVQLGYRESGILQRGVQLDALQLDEGMFELTNIIDNLIENEVGGDFTDISFGTEGVTNVFGRERDREAFITSSYVRPNYRVIFNINSPKTVFLDPSPENGSLFQVIDAGGSFNTNNVTVKSNGRSIEGSTEVVLAADSTNRKWFYRGDLAEWKELTSLTESSVSPFPQKYDKFLALKLSMAINPRYLAQSQTGSVVFYNELRKKFRSEYTTKQEVPVDLGLYRNTRHRYLDYHLDNNSIRFNQGLVY
jgi:hypothetical protein